MSSAPAIARSACSLALLFLVSTWSGEARAQLAVGNWARTDSTGMGMTLTVTACCNGGLRLAYHIPGVGNQPGTTMTVDSPMDGTDVPVLVNGKPSGETMAIKRVDALHMSGVVKMNGQLYGTSTSTMSADGKSVRTESIAHLPDGKTQKVIETWVRK